MSGPIPSPEEPQQQGPMFPAPPAQGAMFPPPDVGPWAPPPKKRFPGALIAVIIVLALVVIGGGLVLILRTASDVVADGADVGAAKAGDCARVTGTVVDPEYKAVPCDSAEVTHIVGRTIPFAKSSCGGDYDEFSLTSKTSELKLCLIPNLAEGVCYDMESERMPQPKVDCAASSATKVTKVVKDRNDISVCAAGEAPWSVPEPPRTMCFARE